MRFQFNGYILDTERFELSHNEQLIHVEPQVIELIGLLVENRDRMVSKEEINDEIWHGRIVSETALSSRIKSARKALGDNGRSQSVIRTIHKKGYRFVATIEDGTGPSLEIQTSEQAKPAIAVFPFENLSSDTEQDYLVDGITSDIIMHLSKHRWLDVTARNTIFGLKGKQVDLKEITQQLGVSYVVEGNVRWSANRIRITANLIDARNGHQKWSERYDRELNDIFALQDEITSKIVARLAPQIGIAEQHKVTNSRPANLRAWDCFHLAMYHFYKFTDEDNLEAQKLFLQCQRRDEQFGESYAWWAYAVILGMVYWSVEPRRELLKEALGACQKALSLDRQNATFYALEARVLLAQKEYNRAIAANEKAISLNPTLAVAHCSLGDSLAYEGKYEDAMKFFDHAIELSPNDPQLWAFLSYGALALIFKQDFEEALEWANRASNIPNCQYWAMAHKLVAHSYLNQSQDVKITRDKLLQECPSFTCSFARKKLFFLKKQSQVDIYLKGLKDAGIKQDLLE